jgi:hypothetical protein
MKCPSKYKDDMKAAEKNLPTSQTTPAERNSSEKNTY